MGCSQKELAGRSNGKPLTSVHGIRGVSTASPRAGNRETEAQSQAGLGERSGLGLHRGCSWGASSSLGFCRTGRGGGNPQVAERPVCWRKYPHGLSVTRPHPRPGPPRGDPAACPLPGAAAGPRTPGIRRRGGEVCFASGVQAEGRGGEGCPSVLRPPLTCEKCCESRGKHPGTASPSPCLLAGTTACRGNGDSKLQELDPGFWGEPGVRGTPGQARHIPQRCPGEMQCPPGV